ncbi:MAG: hypothetical protein HRS57_00425 [Mycoplasmataceae bacterium]|nr:hypothetical protein [Mycoplasmataceae bacterium]
MAQLKRITSYTTKKIHTLNQSEKVGMFILQLQKLEFNVRQDSYGFSWTHKVDTSAGYVSKERVTNLSSQWFINEVLDLIELVTDWDKSNDYFKANVKLAQMSAQKNAKKDAA